ncbi:MAG: Fic family protein [Actinomycetes bacterium]
MTFDPKYGETLLTDEEKAALTDEARALLGEPIRKADLYDLEQQVQNLVADDFIEQVLASALTIDELLTDHFVRELHRRLYAPIWTWGGRQRWRETNIGVAPEQITAAFRNSLDDLRFRWEQGDTFTARELGISTHASLVHIHPFVDGNGRTTRLLADLVFLAAQGEGDVQAYDWDFDRDAYFGLLQDYDGTLDPSALIAFVRVVELGEQE